MSSSNHNIYTNSTGKISIGSQDTKECYVQNGYLYLSGSSGDFTGSTMAVNKEYVDSVASGLDVKDSVRVASTGNVDLANDVYNGVTLDGVVLSTGDRVLLKDQTTGSENGIYIVGANAAAIARSPDMDDNAEVTSGLFTFVESGSSNADAGFVLTTDGSITVGTTAIAFSQFSGAGSLNAGTGISKSGNTFNIDSDQAFGTVSFTGGVSANGGITVDTNKFIVADTTGNTTIAGTLDVTGDTSVSTLDSSGATSLATGGAAVAINASGSMTTVKGTLNVDEAVTLDSSLDVTGDTSVSTLDSTGATSLATGGAAVAINASGSMTTVKGTLNVDEAVTLDSTLDVTGDTSVSTLDSSGATSLATGGAAVAINASGSMTTVKGTLNVDEAVTLDSTLDVTGDTSVSTLDSSGATSLATGGAAVAINASGSMTTVKGTLNVDEAVTLDSTLDVTGDTSVSTLDSSGATSLATGGAAVAINASGSMTTVKGTLNVDEAATFDTTVGITGDLTVDGGDIVASTAENAINIFATTTGKTTLGGGAVDVGATGTATTIKGTLNVDEAVTLDTTLTVTGTTTMNGAVTLGDASTDDVVVTGSLASHLVPKTDSTYNLGSSSIAFTNAYVDNIVSVSDRRLKENIKDQNLGLDFINKLRPVSYNMIDDDDKKVHNGLIAQEVEEVLAESGISLDETSTVMYNSEADKYRMNYIEFVSPLIKSVQELKAENDSLKQTNDALLARLEALEAKVNN